MIDQSASGHAWSSEKPCLTAGCSLLRDVFLRGRSYRQFFDRGFLEIGLVRGAARFQGARVPVAASDRGCFSATLSCLVLAYHLPLSSETGVPELRGKTKNTKKRARCSKAPIYFCFGDFYVLFSKDSEVLKKKPAARRAEFLFEPPSRNP